MSQVARLPRPTNSSLNGVPRAPSDPASAAAGAEGVGVGLFAVREGALADRWIVGHLAGVGEPDPGAEVDRGLKPDRHPWRRGEGAADAQDVIFSRHAPHRDVVFDEGAGLNHRGVSDGDVATKLGREVGDLGGQRGRGRGEHQQGSHRPEGRG